MANGWVVMPQNHRSPGADIINIALTIFTIHIGAVGPLDKTWLTTDATEATYGGVDATGDNRLGLVIEIAIVSHAVS